MASKAPRVKSDDGKGASTSRSNCSSNERNDGNNETYVTDASEENVVLVVLLLCGLPGAGKSSLASHWADLTQQTSETNNGIASVNSGRDEDHALPLSIRLLEYDHLQETVYDQYDRESDDDNDDRLLQAWRSSRQKALETLNEFLQEQQQRRQSGPSVLVMDDNFYLRSMRKQIHQVCARHILRHQQQQKHQSQSSSFSIYFGVVHVQVPLSTCLERNRLRDPSRRVPDRVIESMNQRLEAPSGDGSSSTNDDDPGSNNSNSSSSKSAWWEQAVLTLDGTNKSWTENARQLDRFVHDMLQQSSYGNVPPAVDPEVEEERLEREREQTRRSLRHRADQFTRACVRAVAQVQAKQARAANEVRKHVLATLQQHFDGRDENPDDGAVIPRAEDLYSVKDCFVQGLMLRSKTQPAGSSKHDAAADAGWNDKQLESLQNKLNAALEKFQPASTEPTATTAAQTTSV